MLPTSALLLVGIILKKPLATILICLYSINLILSSRHSDDSIGSLINFSHLNPNVVRLCKILENLVPWLVVPGNLSYGNVPWCQLLRGQSFEAIST